MAKKSSGKAKVIQVLLWYDQPEILLLKKSTTEYILAVASPHDSVSGGKGFQYMGASMTIAPVREYQEEKCDLRFALAHANMRRYWLFDYDPMLADEVEIDLFKLTRSSPFVVDALPEAGFFAREHDRIKIVDEFVPDADEKFDIDGSWDLGEFSKFYGQVEDIYYIFNDIRRFTDQETSNSVKGKISEAFNRPWRGGGSYKGYYDNIANDNMPTARLKVGGIQYNSPGFVRIKAKKLPFDDLIALLQGYADDPVGTRKAYTVLYNYLSSAGLLKASADTEVREIISATIVIFSRTLAEKLEGFSFDTVSEMAKGNVLVAAKVLLSVYRRLNNLYKFFEQGRVAYDGLVADPAREDED